LTDTVLANFMIAKQGSDISAIQAYTDNLKILNNASGVAYANALEDLNTSYHAIPDTSQQAQYFKSVQAVYLNMLTLADSFAFDTTTILLLDSIASQCPSIAGDAVYYARALFAQY